MLFAPSQTGAADLRTYRLLQLGGAKVKWTAAQPGSATLVSYAYVTSRLRFPTARNCAEMIPLDSLVAESGLSYADVQNEIAEAFHMWSSVANISFREVEVGETADILIGAQGAPDARAFADVSNPLGEQIQRSLVCLNPIIKWKIGFDGDLDVYDIRYTVAHEIGHAIGLDHPSRSGELMSYRYDELFRVLQRGDIEGAVALYGSRKYSHSATGATPAE